MQSRPLSSGHSPQMNPESSARVERREGGTSEVRYFAVPSVLLAALSPPGPVPCHEQSAHALKSERRRVARPLCFGALMAAFVL